MKKVIIRKLEELAKGSNQERFKNAALLEKDGEIVSFASNYKKYPDPAGHAEVEVLRETCRKLDTDDLSAYSLYSLYEPCEMCMYIIASANIKKVYFVNPVAENEKNAIKSKREKIESINLAYKIQ